MSETPWQTNKLPCLSKNWKSSDRIKLISEPCHPVIPENGFRFPTAAYNLHDNLASRREIIKQVCTITNRLVLQWEHKHRVYGKHKEDEKEATDSYIFAKFEEENGTKRKEEVNRIWRIYGSDWGRSAWYDLKRRDGGRSDLIVIIASFMFPWSTRVDSVQWLDEVARLCSNAIRANFPGRWWTRCPRMFVRCSKLGDEMSKYLLLI